MSESSPFESAEEYYAAHRPGYGEAAIEYLADRFALDGSAQVLDLGCGTGEIAVPVAHHAGRVVGMDPNPEMLRHARYRAETAGGENVEWVVGSDAQLDGLRGPFRLTTIGRALHWMDHERTLARLQDRTEPGGGVALLGDPEWLTRGDEEWEDEVYAVVGEYVEDLPERTPASEVEYDDPYDELLAEFGFTDVEVATFDLEREWTVDGVVGYVLSLSFCSPEVLGDDRDALERDLRARLGGGEFVQSVEVEVISGRVGASE